MVSVEPGVFEGKVCIHKRGQFLAKLEMSSLLGLSALTWLTLFLWLVLPVGPTWGAFSQQQQDESKARS